MYIFIYIYIHIYIYSYIQRDFVYLTAYICIVTDRKEKRKLAFSPEVPSGESKSAPYFKGALCA